MTSLVEIIASPYGAGSFLKKSQNNKLTKSSYNSAYYYNEAA
jgi:hypothetical protein